jgi:CBS domain-containing protein
MIRVSAVLLAALEMLVQHRITGLPVVDASGRVVSSTAGFKPAFKCSCTRKDGTQQEIRG